MQGKLITCQRKEGGNNMLRNEKSKKITKRILALVMIVAMVIVGLPGNLPYAVQAEDAVIDAGTLSVHSLSDLTEGGNDSTSSFWFSGITPDSVKGNLTAKSQMGGVFLNGVMLSVSDYRLQKAAGNIYWCDYVEPAGVKLKPGDEIMISGEFAGKDSAGTALTVVFQKTVFQYLGSEVNSNGAWAVVKDSGEDDGEISLEDFGLGDEVTVNQETKTVTSSQAVSLDGQTFVTDVLWSETGTNIGMSANILYASDGTSRNGMLISLWGDHQEIVIQKRVANSDGGMKVLWLPSVAKGLDMDQKMRFKIRMDYVDSDLTDTDASVNDICLNIWVEQASVEYHVLIDWVYTDMVNLGQHVMFLAHSSTSAMTCSNVASMEKYLTFCDVGISDGTYTGDNAGVSTYTKSLAGKTLVGDVSYEWIGDTSPGSTFCSIAYGGTDQWSGLHFAYRFDQNILVVNDLVANSETYGTMPMEQDAWYLKNYDAETLGETRKMGIKMVYVDYDNDGSADDACFTISINDKKISENVYIKNGLYLLTNKIYVAPRNSKHSISVSSISMDTVATLSDTVLTVTGNGGLKNTTLEEALAAAQIKDKTAITEIRIEGGYSSIQENTFDGFTALERVFMTDSLTQVSGAAFVNCTESEVIVSNAFGNEFTGGLKNAKVVHHMSVDSVGEESSFENGTLTLHLVPTETVAGVINKTTYTGLQAQINDDAPQAVTMTKTSYGTVAFTLSNIDKTDFTVTILKGIAVASDETYTIQGFELLEDKTVYVNEVAITDTQMAGVDVVATVTEGTESGFYFTTQDNLPTGSESAADNIYAVDGIENGVFVNGEPTEVFLRKVADNKYYVYLAEKNIAVQSGDKVSVSGCFYYGDVMVDFQPFTAEYTVADSTGVWSKVTDTVTVEMPETIFVDGAAEDGGNYLVEGAKSTIRGYDRVSVGDDWRNVKQSDLGIWFTVSPADGLTSNAKYYGTCVYVDGKLRTDVPVSKILDNLYFANVTTVGITPVENMSVVIEGYLSDGTNGVQFERAEFCYEPYGESLKWIYKQSAETDDTTVLYESGDYDITRTIGNVTFQKKVVIYKTGDTNIDNVVDVRDIVNIKKGDYTATTSGTNAADSLVVAEEDDKALLLRELLITKPESKADAVLPQLEGATGAGKYASDYITDVDATVNGTTVLSIVDQEAGDKNYKSNTDYDAYGLDYVLDFDFPEDREIRILQLTDTQIVDATQQRYTGRLDSTSTLLWQPENMEKLVFSYIRETVQKTQPDLILLTGDNIHGEFDDNGECLTALIECMEQLQIPWAPINGNHDNESIKGVQWQSEQYANAKYCLFNRRHAIGGNGNYSIGLAKNGELERVVYMLDSNYCGAKESTNYDQHADYGRTDLIHSRNEFLEGQMKWYRVSQLRVNQVAKTVIPSFCCFHVPDAEIGKGLVWSGYQTVENDDTEYIIGEDGVIPQPGDSGYKHGSVSDVLLNSLYPYMKEVGCDGTFSGHLHYSSTSVYYKGIRWTLGTKTGEYVSHIPEKLGGTLISLKDNTETGESFVVEQKIVTPTTE